MRLCADFVDKLIEGLDYFCHFVKFANRANPALTVVNPDGTHDIYFNLLYEMEQLRAELPHELRHILDRHFEIEIPVELAEAQAESGRLDIISAAKERGRIVCFKSQKVFANYIRALAAQHNVDLRKLSLQDQIESVQVPAKKKKRAQRVKLAQDGN